MAKLTDQERGAVLRLTKFLTKELPAQQRGIAGGLASSLVRLRKNPLPKKDVNGVLSKYDAGKPVLDNLCKLGVLEPLPSGDYLFEPRPKRDSNKDTDEQSADAEQGTQPGGDKDDAAPKEGSGKGSVDEKPSDDKGAGAESDPTPSALAKPTPAQLARREPRSLSHLSPKRQQTPELTQIRRQIIDLDPRLWINGWLLSTPEAYVRFEHELRCLDAALSGRHTLGDGTLSLRELSYRVFGDEKFLTDTLGRKLLSLLGISDLLRTRPEVKLELLHHIPKYHRHLRIVVSENLDPWVNMRDLMFRDGRKRILGERVHGAVFGNGYLVDDPHKLPDLIASLGAEDVTVLYWGDLDRAGLQILARLAEMADGRFAVEPFVAAYRLMLEHAMERFPDPLDNEPTGQESVALEGLELLEPHLKKRELAYLKPVLDNALLIPQEILTEADL